MPGPNDETVWEGPEENTHPAQFGNPPSDAADPNFNTVWGDPATAQETVPRLRPVDQVLDRVPAYRCPKCSFQTNHKGTFEAHTTPDAEKLMQCERERKAFAKQEPGGFDQDAFLAKLNTMLDKKIKKAVKGALADEAAKAVKLARKLEKEKSRVPSAPELPGATGTDRP